MEEPTEREKKLINYIMSLIATLNIYTYHIGYVYKNLEAFETMLENQSTNEYQEEMIEYLNSEFEIPLVLRKDKEYIEEKLEKEK